MHPSLLDAMVSVFLDSLPNSTKAAHTSSAKVTLNGGLSTTQPRTERCSKRKRPPIAEAQTTQDNITEVCVSRSVPNALVLSVLALGKICLHKTRIPDLSLSSDICAQKNSPVLCDGDPGSSLSQNSPPEPPLVQTLSFSSLQDTIKSIAGYRTSPHSFDTASRSYNTERSYETVPGLEYFTLADEIIRSHVSGYTLQHVYTERILDSIVLECPMVSKWVHPDFQFEDSDEPAQDFLEARLRAKYWDFQVILYRKYIDAVLHDRYSSVVQQDGAVYYARLGIFALVQGTKAFHGLKKGQRIPVTNVFTTAHANGYVPFNNAESLLRAEKDAELGGTTGRSCGNKGTSSMKSSNSITVNTDAERGEGSGQGTLDETSLRHHLDPIPMRQPEYLREWLFDELRDGNYKVLPVW
ncbi:putative Zn(2)-C6 fungal-type domain-containing protein [Seiridium cardinale]